MDIFLLEFTALFVHLIFALIAEIRIGTSSPIATTMKRILITTTVLACLLGLVSCKQCTECVSIDPTTGDEINRADACGSGSYVSGYEAGFKLGAADSGWVSTCVRTK